MDKFKDCATGLLENRLKILNVDLAKSPRSIYAAIFAHNLKLKTYELISIGSGLKCLPDKVIEAHPDGLVHDMHAEIICKRAFSLFLYEQLNDIIIRKNNSNNYLLFDNQLSLYFWNPDFELVFYTSQSPCGDASIFKNISSKPDEAKRCRIENNDFIAAGRETDLLGILRTKPGRADSPFSSSMSCSDKISIWNILGIQGSLLTQFMKPVYLHSILIGSDFDRESSERALLKRTEDIEIDDSLKRKGFKNISKHLTIIQSHNLEFKQEAQDDTSIFWYKGLDQVGRIVQGFKKGSKRPKSGIAYELSLQSPLSRQYIFEFFFKKLKNNSLDSYEEEKCRSLDYQLVKKFILEQEPFKAWLVRSDKMKKFRKSCSQ